MKKTIIAVLITVAVLALSIPAAAETFTSSNGILSIELPNENWKEIVDPARWIVLSDGANMITIDHLSNGEKLPEMTVADDHYVNVYQAVFSTQNEVFIITGFVVDAAKISEVANTIVTAKVLQFNTKMKIQPQSEQADISEFSVAPVDKTMYVTSDGLNVRNGWSTNDQLLGGFSYGASVHVTGVVQKGGSNFGWYQVSYNNGTGYVSDAYLSDTAPAAKENSNKKNSDIVYTGTATTVYSQSGAAVTIFKATNGNWYDANGQLFTWLDDNTLSSEGGNTYTANPPVSSLTPTGSPITVYWLNGNGETLTPYSDGCYYSPGWVQYYYAGGGAYAGADGSTLYSEVPNLTNDTGDDTENHGLESQGSKRPVEIFAGGGGYYDESGVEYQRQDDGTYIDSNGDVFDVVW